MWAWNIYLSIFARAFLLLLLGQLCLCEPAFAGSTLSISDEVYGNNATARTKADALDDVWGASFPAGSYRPNLFSSGAGYSGSKSFTDPTGASYQVDWETGYMGQVGPGLPTNTSFTQSVSGTVYYKPWTRIQTTSPNPYPADNRLSTSINGSGLKAVKFDFTNSVTDIYDFGIHVGDLESRPNNGTVGRVIVFDPAGIVIGDHPIVFTGTIQTSGADITYTVTEPVGSPSGPNNNPLGQWGNKTTVFLSVSSDVVIGSVIIHVGDDDHTTSNSGSSEQLGFSGFQIPAAPNTVNNAQLVAEKNIELFDPSSAAYALPGEDVLYSISVANTGGGPVDTDSIFIVDDLPPHVKFYNGDIDGPGPQTEPVAFTQSAAGLTFSAAADVGYSAGASQPASLAACNYAPLSGYDPAVKYICFSPKGSMASGAPDPEFTVTFRAKIN